MTLLETAVAVVAETTAVDHVLWGLAFGGSYRLVQMMAARRRGFGASGRAPAGLVSRTRVEILG